MSGIERQNRQCSMKDRVAEAIGQPSLPRAHRCGKCVAKMPKRGLKTKNVPEPRWLAGQTSLNRTQINGFANV